MSACEAIVHLDWSSYDCQKNATKERLGHALCGTHARQFDKWVGQGRGPKMAEAWWKWNDSPATQEEQEAP